MFVAMSISKGNDSTSTGKISSKKIGTTGTRLTSRARHMKDEVDFEPMIVLVNGLDW